MKLSNKKGYIKHIDFITIDFLILELSLFIASLIRLRGRWHEIFSPSYKPFYSIEMVILFISFIISIVITDSYKNILRNDFTVEFLNVIKQSFVIIICAIVFLYIIQLSSTSSRFIIFILFPVYAVLSLIARALRKKRLRAKLATYSENSSMVVLATSENVEEVVKDLSKDQFSGYIVRAAFLTDQKADAKDISGVPVLGDTSDLIDYTVHNWVDSVTLAIDDHDTIQKLKDEFEEMGITTHTIIAKINNNDSEYVERLGSYIVSSNSYRYIPLRQLFFKRLGDIIGGAIGCIFTLILMIVIGPIIYFNDPGPILFSQERVGKNGKSFKIYKFRSMYKDAEARKAELQKQNKMSDGMMFKMDDDPRIIGSEKKDKNGNPKGIGNFIRKTSLDEFPQFFNILKGDMSLVGPRPPTLDEWQKYSPHHRKRISVRPGLTGMWQVSGRSEITDFEEVVRLDSEYIDTWTNSLDIMILLKTFVTVLKHDGAE